KFFTQLDSDEVFKASANPTYRFLHDRVQQAAYSLIPDSQKKATHLKIGQLLQQNFSKIELEEKLFDIIGHLNRGIELITQPSEREALAKLNLAAGCKARNSTAYMAARVYLQVGVELLAANCWQSQYELTVNLYVAAAEAAYLNADFDGMEEIAVQVLEAAQTILDKIKIYEIQIAAQTAQSKSLEAIAVARDALWQLGVELPTEADEALIGKALEAVASQLQGRRIEELVNLPVITDAKAQAAMPLLATLYSPVFLGMPGLLPLLSCKMVSLSLSFGNAPASTVGYGIHGLVLCAFLGDVETGYAFGKLALLLLDRFNVREFKSMILNLFGAFIQHRKEAMRAVMLTTKDSYRLGMETGDFLSAGYSMVTYSYMNFFSGVELSNLESEIASYSAALAQVKQYSAQIYVDMVRQTVNNLKEVEMSDCLIGKAYDETVMMPKHNQDYEFTAIAELYIYKLLLAYCFGNYKEANNYISKAQPYLIAVPGCIFIPIFHFYAALTHLAVFSTHPEIEQASILASVETHQTTLHQWAQNAPTNHLHKWYLVEAERQRVLGYKADALEMYDRAIQLAKENLFINEEALANELAAKFYLEWGKEKVAQAYMIEAYYCYARWGAKAKIEDLEKRYPRLLGIILQQAQAFSSLKETIARGTITYNTNSSSSNSEFLDLPTLLKASQAISGEIELDKLLTTLLKIAIANAGATKCALLLKQKQYLQVAAIVAEGHEPELLPSIPLESSQDVPISLVNTVKRSLKPLVIVDARVSSQLASDRYIEQNQPISVLCIPILNQGQLIGVLYLENNLTVGAFTSDRIEVLNMLASQAAISLENARLYQESQQALTELKQAQIKIVQSEKMSALGNLVAGVAHEINNPVGFLVGNIQPALEHIQDLFGLLDLYQEKYPQIDPDIQDEIENIDLDYIREDLPKLVGSMQEGVKRIRDISTSLRTFSRADTNYPVACNIHDGIDSTIMILKHRLKANENRPEIKVIKEYGNLPQVECYAGLLNQVFMNLLGNAIDALDESNQNRNYAEIVNKITIKTDLSLDKKQAMIRIKDNGVGMSEAVQEKIFDELFTTKEVGKGTGLGLAIARQIVVEKHGGAIEVNSLLGEGTEFTIFLPMKG
ncbi:ATP-binding protein, partial [Microcoleus sp. Pol14C6]|uniref:ATP-binding protein n=1 Tax=unclassified Microcoleus TaxID=2642155 RepID=UPI002FD26C31